MTATKVSVMTVTHPKLILFTVCLIALMSTAGVAMPYPILAPVFVDMAPDGFNHFMGLPPKLLLGVALAVNPTGILLGSLFIGSLSDRLGRKTVLLTTLALTLLGYVLTAYALWSRNYPLFVLSRFATGLTEGNVAVARAIVADLHPQLDRTRSFALLNAVLYTGWLVGPLVGGLTLPLGEPVPFALAAVSLLPCLVILTVFLPETGERLHADRSLLAVVREKNAFRLLGKDPMLARLFWMQLAFAMGVNAFYEFYPLWLVEFARQDSRGIALVTAGLCLMMTGASIWVGKWFADKPHLPVARTQALVFSAGLFLLCLLPGKQGVWLIMVLGLPLSIYNTLLPVWCSERFDHLGQGGVMGLLSTVFCLSNVAIALLGSVLTLLDTRLVLLLGACTCLLASVRLQALIRLTTRQGGGA
ncbi:MFS transporter [uncultured Aquitalea sp.]|uniref:MFS transporter n=1 Tax=uncultured Aquitalea sp. TaxID=540272 RepID=UPI0025E4F672|nr:MFS transporter [uncultured Aquitalea sp.]